MHLMVRIAFGAIALGVLVAACGDASGDGSTPESGGAGGGTGGLTGGSGGSAGADGGAAGADGGAAGADGGMAGADGGTAGADGGTGGFTGGTGGTGGQWPACESDSDCVLISTCCTCMTAPLGTPEPAGCNILCDTDLCTAQGVSRNDVACERGFCGVVGADGTCNSEDVTCAANPPSCPADYLPSVVDGCWGPCVIQFSHRGPSSSAVDSGNSWKFSWTT